MMIRMVCGVLVAAVFCFQDSLQSREIAPGSYPEQIRQHEHLLFYLPSLDGAEIGTNGGQLIGNAPEPASGPGGLPAWKFSGNSGLTFGPSPQLDLDELTVELWFRPDFTTPPPYNPCLIAKRETGDHRQTRWSVHLLRDYSAIALWNGQAVGNYRWPGGPLVPGKWYHLVVTFSPTQTQVFLNGVLCLTDDETWRLNSAEKLRPLNVASSQPTGAEFFPGAISQVAIYGKILGEDEIAGHTDLLGLREERLTVEKKRAALLRALEEERRRLEEAREQRRRELMEDPALFARGQPTVFSGDRLTAIDMPVGGVGVGAIHFDGHARRHAWQIFGNVPYRAVPHSFFAISLQTALGPVKRILQTVPEEGLPAMAELSLSAQYPLARYEFQDPELPCRVSLETFNPLIPGALRDSAIPCAVYRVIVSNPTPQGITVNVLASQLNVAGYRGDSPIEGHYHPAFGGNINQIKHTEKGTWLVMKQEKANTPSDGLVLMLLGDHGEGVAAWTDTQQLTDLLLKQTGAAGTKEESAGPSPSGQTLSGALCKTLVIPPGQSRAVTFVLTWFFRDLPAGVNAWSCRGRRYEAWWQDAEDVASELEQRLAELEKATRLYVETLYESNLPYWFLDRIATQTAILRSPTVFWCRDGYFGGWEGCNMDAGCCFGNCNHVWHYAQAHARLFPELGRIMREQEFRFQQPDGGIPYRQPGEFPAFDGQCGNVLAAYREHLLNPDGRWLAQHWPAIKKALEYIIQRWDADGDGVLSGPQWNTLDGELGGNSSWLGSLYLAALAAAEEMASLQQDQAAATRYRQIRLSGAKKQDEALFNGRYYIQIPEETPYEDYGEGCAIDQVLGQWWAHQLDLGWIYPPDHVHTALEHLFRYNFRGLMQGLPQRPRKFVADDDAGMQMFVWPEGARRPARVIRYDSEVMTGFEYAAAAAMIQAGLVREGFTVVRAIALRYDGRKRTGLTPGNYTSWGWSGNPFGDDECGKFYARALSSWSLLLACQGLVYDGPAGKIGLRPVWQPENHVSFFTAAEGWGLLRQTREKDRQVNSIELRWGRLPVRVFVAELPPGVVPQKVQAWVGDSELAVRADVTQRQVNCHFAEPVELRAGQSLRMECRFEPSEQSP